MTSYVDIKPAKRNRFNTGKQNDFAAYADVADLVKAGGAGTYWAGDLPQSQGKNGYGAWSLIVVFADDSLPINDMNVFFGIVMLLINQKLLST